jgi:integrase
VKKVRDALTAGAANSRHFDDKGLALIVTGKGTGYWQRRYQLNGKPREMSLGPAHALDLEQARAENRKISFQLAQKIDPLELRRADEAAMAEAAAKLKATATFEAIAAEYIETYSPSWKWARYGTDWQRSLRRYVHPFIGATAVDLISVPDVLHVLEQKVETKDGSVKLWEAYPTTADKLRSRIELILNYAKARGWRSGDNPAAKAVIKHTLPPRARLAKTEPYAALPYSEVPEFWARLAKRVGSVPRALQLLILTATRANETLGARWSEIDFETATWTIPAERMKGGRAHTVPLAPAAIALLKALDIEEGNPFAFAGLSRDGLSPGSLRALLERMDFPHTVHGFRSSFRDWAAERTSFPDKVAEASLAHAIGKDSTERAYLRTKPPEQRRQLMNIWADFVTGTPVKAKAGKVLPIGKR